jgi:amino acid transporter
LKDKPRGRSYVRKARARDSREDGIFSRPADFIRTLLAPLVRLSGGGAPDEVASKDERGGPDQERARIVVPRQERGGPGHSHLGIELREVRYGTTSRTPYLREVRGQREFTQRRTGYLEATEISSRPRGRVERIVQAVKGVVLGSPFATSRLIHERLTKVKALAVLGSDPLSSSAYATEEALIILALAGAGALMYSLPIAVVVAILLAGVTLSYWQTIRAYPSGGGAYTVAHQNLGRLPGLGAAAALIVDYVLLVSVSVAAGVAAITSAVPELHDFRVPMGVGIIALFTLGNLRGIRESGTVFAAPTYFFIAIMATAIGVGFAKVLIGDAPGSLLHAAPPRGELVATQGVTLWLLLRAFSSGSAALTGVEAISNGVPTFKPPETRNAQHTLAAMAIIAIFLFLGITFLSSRFGLVPSEDETIVSMLGRSAFGESILYYAYQAGTALVLFLAANTSYNAFPLLAAILAKDKFMPRQFTFRGDRLAYSNGILVLAGFAALLLVIFSGEVTRLIPLYAVGVFVSFTLSQSGMVRHWLGVKGAGWRASLAINGTGAVVTGIVAVIIGATKFTHGAWISMMMMAILVIMFALIRRHYDWFQRKIAVVESDLPVGVPAAVAVDSPREHVIVPVDGVNKIALGAIGMAREISNRVTAVHITDDPEQAEEFAKQWERAVPDVPLLIIESPYRAFVAPMLRYLERLDEIEEQRITVILPTFVARHWWERILHNRDVLRLRPFLKDRPGVRVVDFPYRLYEDEGNHKDTETQRN